MVEVQAELDDNLLPDTRVLQRDLDSLLAQQAGMQLRAPFDGLVSQFSLLPGMPVREGEPFGIRAPSYGLRLSLAALTPDEIDRLAGDLHHALFPHKPELISCQTRS